jgi:hypothetical protein
MWSKYSSVEDLEKERGLRANKWNPECENVNLTIGNVL